MILKMTQDQLEETPTQLWAQLNILMLQRKANTVDENFRIKLPENSLQ